MIVVDTSIVGPLVLFDERPLPDNVILAMSGDRLIAPPHWPAEIANMLLMASRRNRITSGALGAALDYVQALRVGVANSAWSTVRAAIQLASRDQLTAYDALYLQLAIEEGASLASLDDKLLKAARRLSVPVITRP